MRLYEISSVDEAKGRKVGFDNRTDMQKMMNQNPFDDQMQQIRKSGAAGAMPDKKKAQQKKNARGRVDIRKMAYEDSSPMIAPPKNTFTDKKQAIDYRNQHGGKIYKRTYNNSRTGEQIVSYIVKETVSEDMHAELEETYHGNDFFEAYGVLGYSLDENELMEAEYKGRKVKLNKPMRGDVKKFKVYVKNDKGNVVKVNFGDPNMRIRKSNPKARKSFRARHNCENPGPKWKARYWSCRKW